MFAIFELFGLMIFEYLFTVPGAFLRWIYFKSSDKRITFKECLTEQIGLNYLTSFIVVLLPILLIRLT